MIYAVINFLVVCQADMDMPKMMNDAPEKKMDDVPEKKMETKRVDMKKVAKTAEKIIEEDESHKHSEGDHDHNGLNDVHDHEHHDETLDHKHSEGDHDHTGLNDGHDHDHHDEMMEGKEPEGPADNLLDHESIIDTQDLDTFEELDNTSYADDVYNRFFLVEADAPGPCYVHDSTGEMSEKEYREMYVKKIESRFLPGNCHHDCATPVNEAEICYGFRDNYQGQCEIYLKPASTFQVSKIEENSEFTGIMCSIKGVNCGGHFAINCEHCSPQDSTEPETHCNGHCFYDYKVDYVAQEVTGTCIGKMDVPTVDCGAHLATSCEACPTRYTFVCPLKERYCHGECEEHGCGINCESEEPKTMTAEPEMIEEPMPPTEEGMEKDIGGVEGDGFVGTSFDQAFDSLDY